MYLTGFADEAAKAVEDQIRATKEIGWSNIEARNVGGMRIYDMGQAEFDRVRGKLEAAGVQVNCMGSAIGSWQKKITDPFDITIEEVNRCISRMKVLGTKLVRVMSYSVIQGAGPEEQMEQERFERVRDIKRMFDDAGMTPVHENCLNYGGMGWKYTLRLLENVPGLKLVFDTGNPVFTPDYAKGEPYSRQSAWDFYDHVKEHIVYVHIKDGIWDDKTQKTQYTYPGVGHGDVKKILADLLKRGYDGGISIEPHLDVVFQDGQSTTKDEVRYQNYVEYGRRMKKLVAELKPAR